MAPHDFLDTDDALEAIARVEHERWAHWQRYLHQQCTRNDDGSLTIPAPLAERWERQIGLSYGELTQRERDSDREQAEEYLKALRRFRDSD